MKEIKTLRDIYGLQQHNYQQSFIDCLLSYFQELHESLESDESLEDFSLEDSGYFVVLEPQDDIRKLEDVGLSDEDHGLIGAVPEMVDLIELEEDAYYRIGILCNNEYMQLFFSRVGQYKATDPEAEVLLEALYVEHN